MGGEGRKGESGGLSVSNRACELCFRIKLQSNDRAACVLGKEIVSLAPAPGNFYCHLDYV